MRNGEPGPSKTSQYGVDGTEGTEEPLVEADSSAIEVYRESSSAPEQMRSEPRDLAGPSSIGVDRGAPRCEGHEARSANEPWPGHQSWVGSSVPNPNVRSGADSEFDKLLDDFVASAAKVPPQDRLASASVGNLVGAIRGFSAWLQGKNKPGIIDRLDDDSLDKDVQLYKVDITRDRYYKAKRALEQLWNFQSRGTPPAKRLRNTEPHPQDADLIKKAAADKFAKATKEPGCAKAKAKASIRSSATKLRAFSEWLNRRGKEPIAGRLGQQTLLNDMRAYRSATTREVYLTLLSKYAPEERKTPEPLQAEAESASGAPWADGDLGQPQQSSPADAMSLARAIEFGHDWELEAGEPSSLEGGLDEWDFDVGGTLHLEGDPGPTSFQELPEPVLAPEAGDLGQPQQSSPAGAIPPWAPTNEFGHVVPLNFEHRPQPASDVLIGELNRRGMMPSLLHPENLMVHGQPYIAKLQAGVREVTVNNPGGKNVVLTPGCGELGQQSRPRVERINEVGPSGGFRPELEPRRDRHIPLGPDQSEGTASGSGIRPQGLLHPFGQPGLQEPARSSSTWSPRVPSDFDSSEWLMPELDQSEWDLLRGVLDLPSTPQEMRDDAQSRPVLSPAGRPPFFIGPSGKPQELEDIGYLVGEDWQHGSQPVPEFLLDVLDNKMLLPSSQMAPQPVSINGETYSIALGPRGRRAQLIHHPGPSSVPEARIGASTASASASDRSGRVLGAGEWLGDAHIQRDYELLSQELRQSNPNLADQTRFVDPLIAFQVGHGTHGDALDAFHRIVNDRNGNDTADFLFLPVSDASATDLHDRGSHWSLLLVDRRVRDRPVAYHYDSAKPYNDGPAATLAARVGADLRDGPIREQRNGHDCGVFLLDGTRALVELLARGVRPDQGPLNLEHLVVDRQALRERLSHSG